MSVTYQLHGKTLAGETVGLYTLANAGGMEVRVGEWGATVCSIRAADRAGQLSEVTLGYDSLQDYLNNPFCYGSTVGRYCNRIARGRFCLNDVVFVLPQNDGRNHIHGGTPGFSHRLWRGEQTGDSSVRMQLFSAHGDQGYPGNLHVSVEFELTEENELKINYEAGTDQDTVINLTNHTYFNLRGEGAGTVNDQILTLHETAYVVLDEERIPTGEIADITGSELNFRDGKPFGSTVVDHHFGVMENAGMRTVAEVLDPVSGRRLTVSTDQPGVHVYTADWLDGSAGRCGMAYPPRSGFCLETQHAPDSPNRPEFPSTQLKPGHPFRSETRYFFEAV
jgi:aldose 1-epimerase